MEVRQLATEGIFKGEYDINAAPIRIESQDAQTTLLYVGPGEPMAFRTMDLLKAIEDCSSSSQGYWTSLDAQDRKAYS